MLHYQKLHTAAATAKPAKIKEKLNFQLKNNNNNKMTAATETTSAAQSNKVKI